MTRNQLVAAVGLILMAAFTVFVWSSQSPSGDSHEGKPPGGIVPVVGPPVTGEFEEWSAELAAGGKALLRTKLEEARNLEGTTLETLGPLDPASKARLASRFQRYYLRYTESLHKLWKDLGAASPDLDVFFEAGDLQMRIDRYSAMAQILEADQYWTVLASENYDLPSFGSDVRYTISSAAGLTDGKPVSVIFPIQRTTHGKYHESLQERSRLKELSLLTFVDEFNALPIEERLARYEAHRQATLGLQEENARDSSPEELQKLHKQRFPRGTEYLEASATLRVK